MDNVTLTNVRNLSEMKRYVSSKMNFLVIGKLLYSPFVGWAVYKCEGSQVATFPGWLISCLRMKLCPFGKF